MKKNVVLALIASSIIIPNALAAIVNLTGSDGFGTSSYNSGLNWSDSTAPGVGNDYVVGSGLTLRTPTSGSHVFGGDSLTVQGEIIYKSGNANTMTVNNLVLDGGKIFTGINSAWTAIYDGAIDVTAAGGTLDGNGCFLQIDSDLSGSGDVLVENGIGSQTLTFNGTSTLTGNINFQEVTTLSATSGWLFDIGASGVNNYFLGGFAVTVDGTYTFDLASAGTTIGDSWDVAQGGLNESYGASFNVAGFTDNGGGVWTANANGAEYQFDESTSVLQVVPEPATIGLFGLFGAGMFVIRRKFMI